MKLKDKFKIPKEFRSIWYKDYYKLTKEERQQLIDFYIKHLQTYEALGASGGTLKKLDPPHFMTQDEILKKEEDVKMDAKAVTEKEKKNLEIAKALEEHKIKWESKRFIKMEETEKLRFENFQLKLELVERALKDATEKKNEIVKSQTECAKKIEEKYEIVLDNYAIDLITGIMIRYPEVGYKEPLQEELEKK